MFDNRFSINAARSSKRVRCSLSFFSAGIGIGAWAASLPSLSAKVGLDKGQLGILLLCFALGAIVLMVNIGRFIDRLPSSYPLSFWGSVVFGTGIFLVPFTDNLVVLGGIVFATGAGFGTFDVSINTEASEIERETDRHLMSSFHALFSVGNILGASLVGTATTYGGHLRECLAGAGVLVILTMLATLLIKQPKAQGAPRAAAGAEIGNRVSLSSSQRLLVLLLGTIAFLAFLAEGGIMDWTAVYMVGSLNASESVGAYAFAIFASAMAVGRFLGDGVTKRAGHVNILRVGGLLCALSLLTMLLGRSIPISLFVLALCGFGVANMIPAVFAAAGKIGSNAAGRAMSIVTTMGYSGLLLGPAGLGFVAQASSLGFSLALVALAFCLIAVGTFYLDRRLKEYHASIRVIETIA